MIAATTAAITSAINTRGLRWRGADGRFARSLRSSLTLMNVSRVESRFRSVRMDILQWKFSLIVQTHHTCGDRFGVQTERTTELLALDRADLIHVAPAWVVRTHATQHRGDLFHQPMAIEDEALQLGINL